MGLIMAILSGMLITGVLSAILGYFISFKKISDSIASKLNVDEFANPFKMAVISSLVGDTIMTPLFCFIFIAKNVSIHGICQYMKGLEHRKYHPMNMNFSWKMILNLLVNMEMI